MSGTTTGLNPSLFYLVVFRVFKGQTLRDIEKNWVLLEKAEHERERALQEALLHLETLEQLAQKFGRKVLQLKFIYDSQMLGQI